MADVTRYIRTSADAAGDGTTDTDSGGNHAYQSLAAFVTAEAADLATDDWTAQCSVGSGSAADTTVADLTGFSNGTLTVRAKAGEEASTEWDAAKYRLAASPGYGAPVLDISDTITITIRDLQIDNTSGASNRPYGIQLSGGASVQTVDIDGCYIRQSGAATSPDNGGGIVGSGTGASVLRVWNTIIDQFVNAFWQDSYNNAAVAITFANVTMRDQITNGVVDSGNLDGGTFDSRNLIISLAGGATTSWSLANIDDTDAVDVFTSDANSPSSDDSKSFTFVSATDHAITDASDGYDEGTDLSAYGPLSFSDDIDGTTRPEGSVWDVGAFEVIQAGGGGRIMSSLAGAGGLAGPGGIAGQGGGLAG